jgi:uncharacterized protein YodC (DUF2158 family)
VQCGNERHAGGALKGFPGFLTWINGRRSHSTIDENGINKKNLRRLISIVNLAKPFRVFLQQVESRKIRRNDLNTVQRFRRGMNMLTATIDAFQTPSAQTPPAARFNVGDVVTLKEGGSRMTVTYAGPVALNPGDWLICEWFDEHGELRREMFSPASVRTEPRSIPAGSVRWNRMSRAA